MCDGGIHGRFAARPPAKARDPPDGSGRVGRGLTSDQLDCSFAAPRAARVGSKTFLYLRTVSSTYTCGMLYVLGSSRAPAIALALLAGAACSAEDGPGSPYGDMGSIKTIDNRTTEMVYTRNGKVSRRARRTVSADGKTLIIEATGTNGKGEKYQSTAVFEKQ